MDDANGNHADRNGRPASTTVTASDLKTHWHAHLDRVFQARETITVTRYGKPVAKLTPIDEEAWEADE